MTEHIPDSPEVSYWDVSTALREILERKLSESTMQWALPQLRSMGEKASREVAPLSAIADRESPRLVTHSPRGERIDRVDYHPAYREMETVAYGSGMVGMKYDSALLAEHGTHLHLVGFALGYLFGMAEAGLYCPVCMTDGAARVISRFGSREQIDRVVPHLAARERPELWTGAMFLTEKAGGSDVGANETIATRDEQGAWTLQGEKWFCSNVDAEVVLATARPEGGEPGTRGLETFLILTSDNPGVRIDRLKEKLGVRSMPTGEVTLEAAPGEPVGDFRAITEMLNLSRLYNSVASVAVMGRAILEARHYIERRRAFDRPVVDFPLAQETLFDLEAEHRAAMLMTFEAVDLLARADRGDEEAALTLRLVIPMAKAVTGKLAVPVVSESMELIGGNAYIEESPLPRLLRDAQVLPIWEGTTNILVLDALRAARKKGSHRPLLDRIRQSFPNRADELAASFEGLEERFFRQWVDHLARAFQLTLLAEVDDQRSLERLVDRPLGLRPGAKL